MKRSALVVVSAIAVILGLWHGQLAMQAVFVFREGEPIASWLAIALGPATTLIASLLAIFMRRTGGILLVALGAISFLAFVVGEGKFTEHVVPFLLQISLPMIAVGVAFLLMSKVKLKRPQGQ